MIKRLSLVAVLIGALSGCATVAAVTNANSSSRTRVAAVGAEYLVAQEGIKTYLVLPPCVATTLPTCKSPAVVAVLQKSNMTVSNALDTAETLVTTPGANPDTIEVAITVALEAYKSLKTTKANFGVK